MTTAYALTIQERARLARMLAAYRRRAGLLHPRTPHLATREAPRLANAWPMALAEAERALSLAHAEAAALAYGLDPSYPLAADEAGRLADAIHRHRAALARHAIRQAGCTCRACDRSRRMLARLTAALEAHARRQEARP